MDGRSEFLPISEATFFLQKGMFGQKNLPNIVVEARKKIGPKFLAGVGQWREQAAACILTAALAGKLKVYVTYEPDQKKFEIVSPNTLKLIVPVRSALPDHPTRIAYPRSGPPLIRLSRGALFLSKSEFECWYRAEKAKRKWPSQEGASKRPIGRPRVSADWRARIKHLVEGGEWSAQKSIPTLKKSLAASEFGEAPPSDDALARIVDELLKETGDDRYRRKRRRPSRKTPNRHGD